MKRHQLLSCLTLTLYLALPIVAFAGIAFYEQIYRSNKGFTEMIPDEVLGIKMQPIEDQQTGFVQFGTNETTTILGLESLNGKSIDKLEKLIATKDAVGGCSGDFLDGDERLLDTMAKDNITLFQNGFRRHAELAHPLLYGWKLHEKYRDRFHSSQGDWVVFTYNDVSYLIQVNTILCMARSPINQEDDTSIGGITVYNLRTGQKIRYSPVLAGMMARYGFYGGKGTRARVEPEALIDFFRLDEERWQEFVEKDPVSRLVLNPAQQVTIKTIDQAKRLERLKRIGVIGDTPNTKDVAKGDRKYLKYGGLSF